MIESLFIRSWWVIAFLLCCAILFERGMAKRDIQFQQMKELLADLDAQKDQALKEQQNLKLQINSQSDLAWIELMLMKRLGLCPEDQQKFYFTSSLPSGSQH